jgi:hypothetical protein
MDRLVEVLGGEVEIARAELLQHPFDLVHRRAPAGRPPAPPVDQTFRALLLIGVPQPTEMPLTDPQ